MMFVIGVWVGIGQLVGLDTLQLRPASSVAGHRTYSQAWVSIAAIAPFEPTNGSPVLSPGRLSWLASYLAAMLRIGPGRLFRGVCPADQPCHY
jgi:hypothetical protein